jgi:hypothetical protein
MRFSTETIWGSLLFDQEAAGMAVAARKWRQQAAEASVAAQRLAEIAYRKGADAEAALAEANAAQEEAARLKDDLDYLLLIGDKTAAIHRRGGTKIK